MTPEPDVESFQRLYSAYVDPLLGYALRRVSTPADAADVVAETFLVAWRRRAEVPAGEATRLWLYGVARRVLANQRRGELRRSALGSRLREELPSVVPDPAGALADRTDAIRALAQLRNGDREVVELTAWEGLDSREIAEVLGITPVAARARLSRARSRLRGLLGHDPVPAGHEGTATTRTIQTVPQEDR
jgi:RNA polymerase sigma factor (sigma-70 family)